MRFDLEMESGPGARFPRSALEGTADEVPGALPSSGSLRRRGGLAKIRVARRLPFSPDRVFGAWLDAGSAGRWLFATASQPITEVEIEARVGGAFRFVERRRGAATAYAGRYLEIVPPRRLAFTLVAMGAFETPASASWPGRAAERRVPTRVTIDIAPRRRGCELVLAHEDVPRDERERTLGRWIGILYGLSVVLDAVEFSNPRNQERKR